nr:hypothetical protein [Tanacetum cinerariifolium]
RTPTVTGQMANSVALVAFGSTQTIMFLLLLFNSSANFWQWHLLSSGSSNNLYWQRELILPVGTLILAVGMPYAFYS